MNAYYDDTECTYRTSIRMTKDISEYDKIGYGQSDYGI